MSLSAVTVTAGLASTAPSTETRPSAIQRSASRREHRPARASNLAMRSGAAPSPAAGSASSRLHPPGGLDKGAEDAAVGLADLEFGMPLHAEAKAPARVLDALDHAVLGDRVDDDARPGRLDRLMVGAVDREVFRSGNAVQQGSGDHPDIMAGLVARVRLAVRQCPRHLVRDMLDQGAAQRHIQQLLAAADPEHRHLVGRARSGSRQVRRRCAGPWS